MRYECYGEIGRLETRAHHFDLGGQCREETDAPCEDCYAWAELEDGSAVLVVAAGYGRADGHLGSYLNGSAIACGSVGSALATLVDHSDDNSVKTSIHPEAACAAVQEAISKTVSDGKSTINAQVLVEIIEATAKGLFEVLAFDHIRSFAHAGCGTELAVLHISSQGQLSFAQSGAIAAFLVRGKDVERIAPLNTLGEEASIQGTELPNETFRDFLTSCIYFAQLNEYTDADTIEEVKGFFSVRDPNNSARWRWDGYPYFTWLAGKPTSAERQIAPEDRLFVLTRGIHAVLANDALRSQFLLAEPHTIPTTLVNIAKQTARGNTDEPGDHPTAVIITATAIGA